MNELQAFAVQVEENVSKVMVGQKEALRLLLVAMLVEGHVLLEDVPGVGKTMLARSLAVSLGGEFRRLQCTPDLLPNDVTGVSIFNQQQGEFEFRAGPVFVNVLLVDEINRATPRTQSALLEAMQERQVTVDGVTRPLPQPFLVTQVFDRTFAYDSAHGSLLIEDRSHENDLCDVRSQPRRGLTPDTFTD